MAYWATNYLEQKFLNVLKGTTFTAPTNVYIGLYTANPTDTGTHTSEVNYTGYARQKITFYEPSRPTGEAEISIKNNIQVTFPKLQATAASVTITYMGVSDNITRATGNMLFYGPLQESLVATGDEAPVFIPNEVIFYANGSSSDVYKKKLLNTLKGVSITGFTSYAALFNGDPENGGSELGGSGTNYSRKSISFSAITANGDKSQMQNSAAVIFNRASTNWTNKNLTYRVIYDALTGGSPVWKQQGTTKTVSKGRQIIYEAGDIKVAVD